MKLCSEHRGVHIASKYEEATKHTILEYQLPLGEIATYFYNDLKSKTHGYATFNYEDGGYLESDLVKVRSSCCPCVHGLDG